MSTVPVVPTVAAQTWLQKHERLILVTLFLAVALWLGNKWLVVRAANDNAQVVAAAQQLNEQKLQNQQLADQVKQTAFQYQQTLTAITAENIQIATTIKQRDTQLTRQQQSDQTVPLSDLGQRWAMLANIPPTGLTTTPTDITADISASRQTVVTLEQVPILQQDLKDITVVSQNRQDALTACSDTVNVAQKEIAGLQTQIDDEERSCKAVVASVKADARKSKLKWFGAGFVTGLITGLLK